MLIPCIQEYRDAKIFDSIWWEPCDFRTFQVDLSIAFKKFMQKTTCSDLKEALKLFILDELECGDESNQNFSPLKRSREPSPIIPSETMMPLAKRAKV